MTDLGRVAPCMPGATLEEVDGDTYGGRMKVKVGPMSLTYAGTANLTEQDPEAHTARIEASGREKRGGGTASADVRASMVEADEGTRVVVTTDINVTGKPAQFGRGVMADLGAKITVRFADNLRDELATDRSQPSSTGPADVPTGGATRVDAVGEPSTDGAAGSGPRPVAHRPPRDEALDLMDVAGVATAKRLIPILLAIIVLLPVWRRQAG